MVFKAAISDNKIFVNSLNLHEISNKIFGDYNEDFELIGNTVIGQQKQTKATNFKKFDHYGSYINNSNMDYDADDTVFTD